MVRQGFTARVNPFLDGELAKLVDTVYWRLPAHDRHSLRELVTGLNGPASVGKEGILAHVTACDPNSFIDGIQAVYEECAIVSLHRVLECQSEASRLYVIAHEFAHVILRHWQIGATVENLNEMLPRETYRDSEVLELNEMHEDHADLQAWIWGFSAEMATFYEEYPQARKPRWYVSAEWEKPS